ncbi:MAG: CAP domain-containing protein [Sporichthyaceae bacterium]
MRATRRTTGWLVSAALLASTFVGLNAAPASASTSSILSAVNSARAGAGRRPLSLRSDLSAVAYRWSQHMAATGTLAHNPSLTRQVSNWRWVGENVGYGPDWSAVETAFMNSPGHRSNILDSDYSQIGIGVVIRGNRVWITQVFRSPSGSSTAAKPRKPTPVSRTRTPAAKPAARPARKPAPTATQLLERRITTAKARRNGHPASDPLLDALGFADAMRTVGG